jgi:hypothetical protein
MTCVAGDVKSILAITEVRYYATRAKRKKWGSLTVIGSPSLNYVHNLLSRGSTYDRCTDQVPRIFLMSLIRAPD